MNVLVSAQISLVSKRKRIENWTSRSDFFINVRRILKLPYFFIPAYKPIDFYSFEMFEKIVENILPFLKN